MMMRNMPLFKEFEASLREARLAIKSAKGDKEPNLEDAVRPPKSYTLLPEVAAAFEKVKNSVLEDISRYSMTSTKEAESPLTASINSENDETAEPNLEQLGEQLPETQGRFSDMLVNKLETAMHKPVHSRDIVNQEQLENLDAAEKYLYMVIAKEADGIESISFTKKLKKILFSIGEKRIEEAIILARNLKKDDPHNNTVFFILSQILYFKACRSNAACLPEAREEAKKACTYVENFDEGKLLRYRYHCIATERIFSPERTVDIMRSYYMTNPESLTGKGGISANHFYNLRCWIILSTIPTKLWHKFEVESLEEITEKAIGGALIYIYYLRGAVLTEIDAGNEMFKSKFAETEDLLANFYHNYSRIKNTVDTCFNSKFVLKDTEPYLWTALHRCVQYLLAVAPMPSSDEVLMHCSLDARSCEADAYPENNMLKIGLEHTDYWKSWALALTPFSSTQKKELIPINRLADMQNLFKIYTDMLTQLENLEREALKDEDWDLIIEYMPMYAFENLLEIGYGGTNTQLLQTKEDKPFVPYYKEWRKKTLPSPLPSDMIKQHAKNGAFINFKEVHTLFEGIYRVFASAPYNLRKHIEDAKIAYNAVHNIRARKPIGKHISELWWFYFLIMPIAIITFLVLVSSSNPAHSLKILTTIIAGLIIMGAVVVMILPKKKS
jgi:hypothetical protein